MLAIKAETAAGWSAYATVSDKGTDGHTWSVVAALIEAVSYKKGLEPIVSMSSKPYPFTSRHR